MLDLIVYSVISFVGVIAAVVLICDTGFYLNMPRDQDETQGSFGSPMVAPVNAGPDESHQLTTENYHDDFQPQVGS